MNDDAIVFIECDAGDRAYIELDDITTMCVTICPSGLGGEEWIVTVARLNREIYAEQGVLRSRADLPAEIERIRRRIPD